METKMIKPHQVDEVVDLLKKGELVALPTETVYGLAADAQNEAAVQKIFIAKGRPSDHPLIVHIDSFENIETFAQNVSLQAKKLADHFWPGPLTMVLHKQSCVSDTITAGLHTVAIRVPHHPIFLEVIKKLGNGIVAPSANSYQKTSPTSPVHVLKTLAGKIAAVVDGGPCSVGIESTIVDMTKDIPIILRPGAITQKMIQDVLNVKVEAPVSHREKVSGNMENHYQPEKPLFLLSIDQIHNLVKTEKNIAVMHYSDMPKLDHVFYYQMPQDKSEYTKNLYSAFYHIDNTDVEKVFVEMPPCTLEWVDVLDRLAKACKK